MTALTLDTNILLLDANNLFLADHIFLPETVIDEIDSKKSGLTEISFQAREFGRLLTKATKLERQFSFIDQTINIVSFLLDNTYIHICSLPKYSPSLDIEVNIRNDRKIIEVAYLLQTLFESHDSFNFLPKTVSNAMQTNTFTLEFMTNDVMCRVRAQSLGCKTADFKEVDKVSFDFIKTLAVDDTTFSSLHLKPILSIDPSYLPENHNYIFTTPMSNQIKAAVILEGSIHIIGKTTEDELHRQDIAPINIEQLLFARAINEPTIDVVVCEALSGSGKTIVALSNAIKLVKSNSIYKSIIYIRNSIDDYGSTEEEIGFLSGNEDKLAVYLQPLWDTLDSIVRSNYRDSKHKGEVLETKVEEKRTELIERCNIQGIIGLGLRGRTFDNAIVIIDEAQNIPKTTMQKILTRIGKQCKVIIIGSNKQIDSRFINKFTNGLSVLLDACAKPSPNSIVAHAVTLNKVVRGKIADWAEHLFSN